jgi:2-oxoglutarate ferredoxin oxidoreductase subunit alpha
MMQDLTWAIGGEAGFGMNVAGFILAKIFSREKYAVIATNEYPSLIRGSHNFVSLRVSTREIFAPKQSIDILVALNKETVDLHKKQLARDAIILFDPDNYEWEKEEIGTGVVLIPMKFSGAAMKNTIALGATIALLGKDFSILSGMLHEQFSKKGEGIIAENIKVAEYGYQFVKDNYKKVDTHVLSPGNREKPQLVVNASEAVGLGAIAGGMKFAAIYPMTPINSLIPLFADHAKDLGIVYKQPEDEIAGINMAIGASLAGARSMVATSGGGFALMVEGVSMAGIMEVPLVVDLGMRPGPATGMPTWTEQGELWMAIHAGHGEFARIVLAPGDAEDSFALTKKAFHLAEKYQIPVFVLTDKYLNESLWQMPQPAVSVENTKLAMTTAEQKDVTNNQPFLRYDTNTKDGVSLRSLPGMSQGEYVANSYEHGEDGYTTEDAGMRKRMVDKRMRKTEAIRQIAEAPVVYGDSDADIAFVCFGSVKGVIRQAIDDLKKDGKKAKLLFFGWVYPLPESIGEILAKEKRVICVEQNATGQLASVIREQTGFEIKEKWLKYDGRQWTVKEILEKYGR